MELLQEGADIHNKLHEGMITDQEGKQLLDTWWNKVEDTELDTNMTLNLMMMYRTIIEKIK